MAFESTSNPIRYGEATLAGADAAPVAAPEAPRGLTWGKVLKGVAVVATIAVVAVVGYVALYGLATWAMGIPAVSGAVGTVAPAVTSAASSAAYGAGWLSSFVTVQIPAFFSGLATGLGFTAPAAVAAGAATTSSIVSGAGIVGAGGAAAIAASHHHGIADFFDSVFSSSTPTNHAVPDDATSAFMATKKASFASGLAADHGSHAAHASADLAHHAGEHHASAPRRSWAQQVSTPNRFSYNGGPEQSYAEAVRAQQSRSPVQPRDPNFAQQLDADRAKLDDALNSRA